MGIKVHIFMGFGIRSWDTPTNGRVQRPFWQEYCTQMNLVPPMFYWTSKVAVPNTTLRLLGCFICFIKGLAHALQRGLETAFPSQCDVRNSSKTHTKVKSTLLKYRILVVASSEAFLQLLDKIGVCSTVLYRDFFMLTERQLYLSIIFLGDFFILLFWM